MTAYQREDRRDADVKTYWRRTKYEYDAEGDIIYKGQHRDFDADIADLDWSIIKYTYNINKDVEDKQIANGVWNDRAAIGW